MFWTIYVISVIYCVYKMYKSYTKKHDDPLKATPGLETLAIMIMAPVLMAVDVSLTWMRLYKEAEGVRRKRSKLWGEDEIDEEDFIN